MYPRPAHHDAFVATLPIAGRDGTIAIRMKGTPAEGNARAKTGSIANVRSAVGLRADTRRRDPGVLDPGQQLHRSRGDRELDRGPRGRDARRVHPRSNLDVEGRGSGALRSVPHLGLRLASPYYRLSPPLICTSARPASRCTSSSGSAAAFRSAGMAASPALRMHRGLSLPIAGPRIPRRQRLDQPRNGLHRIVADDPEVGDGNLPNAGSRIGKRVEERGNNDLRIDGGALPSLPSERSASRRTTVSSDVRLHAAARRQRPP